ncbi:MAG: glycerophosphoryl diester phosphodiesterase membrane domain-containing protein [Flavobacteriales bacterium]|nr:glycerophosphoryl diester phosphodiesterase membrane domain-containing protein [Flavobacteriales bacterium]
MNQKIFSISNVIEFGWNKFKENPTLWLGLSFITVVVGSLSDTESLTEYAGINLSFPNFSGIVFGLISAYLSLAIYKITIENIRGNEVSFNDLTEISLNQFINYIIAAILSGILIVLGCILFIIPGIHIAIRFMFIPYLIVDKNLKFDEAMKESWRITKDNSWNLFVLALVFFLLVIAGFIMLFVGIFVAIPIIWLATASIYLLFTKEEEIATL